MFKIKMPKKVTIEKLAAMVAEGFAHVDRRFDAVEERLESLEDRMEHAVTKFELKELQIRVGILEKKAELNS